jgi:hypothetical protein
MTAHRTPPPALLDSRLPADAFDIGGVRVVLQSADRGLRRLARRQWQTLGVPVSASSGAHAVFRIDDGDLPSLPRLATWHHFTNDRFLFLSDGKRYLVTGHLYDHPWQIDIRSLPEWDPGFVYYSVVEPILLDVLKKLGVLVWHSAAVEKGGMAVLIPGASGSGKSTTTLNLLQSGYSFLADDVALIRSNGRGLEVLGHETSLYVTETSLGLVPDWRARKVGRRLKKGRRWKSRLDVSSLRSTRRQAALLRVILFPRVRRGSSTSLEQLNESEALLACLDQTPKEYPASILGPTALESQFAIYSRLVSSAACYRIHLGRDQEQVRAALSSLIRRA